MAYLGNNGSPDHGGFSTDYDLWKGSPLEEELYAESVSPLATRITHKLEHGFKPNVGKNRMSNVPGPLYEVDHQSLDARLKTINKQKWDKMGVPDKMVKAVTPKSEESAGILDFVSRRPVTSALIGLAIYVVLG